jgi:NTE family protein
MTSRSSAKATAASGRTFRGEKQTRGVPFECVALLLQGGGALGSYQAGVYQALHEHGLQPHWVAGISIGAINAAIIAGNAPENRVRRLRAFWELVTSEDLKSIGQYARGDDARDVLNQMYAGMALARGVPGFFKPRMPPPFMFPPGTPEATSWYDTSDLKLTLESLIDFGVLNDGTMRLSVGATNIASGNFVYFDSATQVIGPEHIMASGALPPGFPAVEIEGEQYWDGGLVSNTPLDWVLNSSEQMDTLAFQVDLWSARGDFPRDMMGVTTRQKEIQYSSRTRESTDRFKQRQRARAAIANLFDTLPGEYKQSEDAALLQKLATRKAYNIVHLIYHARNFEGISKDFEFSRRSMEEHWKTGYYDTERTLRHKEILERSDRESVQTFDFAHDSRHGI